MLRAPYAEPMSSRRFRQLLVIVAAGFAVTVIVVVWGLVSDLPVLIAAGGLVLAAVVVALLIVTIVLLGRLLDGRDSAPNAVRALKRDVARVHRALGSEPGSLQARLRHDVLRDAQALRTLHDALPSDREHVPLTSYSALPATALLLTEYVRELPSGATIVELGSGATTLWLALAAQRRGGDVRVISLDTSAEWATVTRAALARNGVDALVDLRVAELAPVTTAAGDQNWYEEAGWRDLADIALLFVDGPPGSTGELARFPAIELLGARLAPGAIVVVDDADRDDEREIIRRWSELELPGGRLSPFEQRERTVSLRLG